MRFPGRQIYLGTFLVALLWQMVMEPGYGYHGDFISGWEPASLKIAGEKCSDLSGQVEKCSTYFPPEG